MTDELNKEQIAQNFPNHLKIILVLTDAKC